MKKIILILTFISITTLSLAQTKKEDYKDYKVCTECFQSEKWQKTGLDNYGIVTSPRKKRNRGNGYFAQQGKTILYGVSAIFVGALTLIIYNAATNATTH